VPCFAQQGWIARRSNLQLCDDPVVLHAALVEMARISEDAERDSQLLGYLDAHSVKPGTIFLVAQVAPWIGTIMLRREGDEFPIGLQVATKLYVRPLATPATS
jgi:hypothetical protein